ncbi:MAG TPA: hypothetical protein PKL44_00230 [Candidatus Dojkabacteria bacterium]|nr:hypothetical protein [Candidatus Dojkabacteria bacterium]
MQIRFTSPIKDEDGYNRDDLKKIWLVFLWKDHPNYHSVTHRRHGQQDMLIIGRPYPDTKFAGWFLSITRFRKFVLDGTIIILTQGDSI